MLAVALTGRGRLRIHRGRVEPAIELLNQAIEELRDRGGDPEFGPLYGQLARAYSLHEESEAGIRAADAALGYAGRAGDAQVIAETLVSKSTALAAVGRIFETIALLRGALNLAERRGFTAA